MANQWTSRRYRQKNWYGWGLGFWGKVSSFLDGCYNGLYQKKKQKVRFPSRFGI